ncbi:hypothetical protein G6F56_003663 [Rhizopus delemar]|nr:hypothetical protein G6F56_003663 [Rhizopus delemar]
MNTCKSLIVRNLAINVTENDLKSIFNIISPVQSLCIMTNIQCGVIEFQEHRGAEQALLSMNKRPLCGQVISIEWNYENSKILIKQLDSNITRNILFKAFEKLYATDVRLMKNNQGVYGTVSFPTVIHAEIAALEMNGHIILSCPIEIILDDDQDSTVSSRRSSSTDSIVSLSTLSYQDIFAKTPLYHTTIYVKNLPKNVAKQEIVSLLQQYGMLYDLHINTNKRMAIIKLDTHANATAAIFGLRNIIMDNETIRLGWWTKDANSLNICSPFTTSIINPSILDLAYTRAPAFVNNESINQYY